MTMTPDSIVDENDITWSVFFKMEKQHLQLNNYVN
jgi:hypothetical protein